MNRIVKANFFLNVLRLKAKASFDCTGCKKKLTNPECNACHKMVSYFSIFQIPQKYQINLQQIKDKAKNLQKQYHPDKHHPNTDKEKFQTYSAYINSAKNTLLDDLKRAEYLVTVLQEQMELKGVHINQQTTIQDSQFMMDIFELQEEIQNTEDNDELKGIHRRLQMVLNELKHNLEQFFKSEDLEKCREFIFKYKYFYRAIETVQEKIK